MWVYWAASSFTEMELACSVLEMGRDRRADERRREEKRREQQRRMKDKELRGEDENALNKCTEGKVIRKVR